MKKAKLLKKSFLKTITYVVVTAFTINLSLIGSAQPSQEYHVPLSMGSVSDLYKGSGGKTIIHIQDAHCNYSAQQSIAGIISFLRGRYGIDLVFMEGGRGKYDLSVFTDIPDPEVRSWVSDRFVREGIINGPEFAAINSPDGIELFGIEDERLYDLNVQVYRDSISSRTKADKYIAGLMAALSDIKKKHYSEDLILLDERIGSYKKPGADFKEYQRFLVRAARNRSISPGKYPNIEKIVHVLEKEDSVDFKEAEIEQDFLMGELRTSLSRIEAQRLGEIVLAYKKGDVARDDFYERLLSKARLAGVDISDLPNLVKFSNYVAIYERIDKTILNKELLALEKDLMENALATDAQRDVYRLDKDLNVLKRLFDVALTRDEYNYYLNNEESFDPPRFLGFLNKYIDDETVKAELSRHIEELNDIRKDIVKFYEYPQQRDKAFLENIADKMSQKGEDVAVLVTGGFHAGNLSDKFREKGYAYISIMPVMKAEPDSPYFKLLSGEKTDLYEFIYRSIGHSVSGAAIAIKSLLSEMGVDMRDRGMLDLQVRLLEHFYPAIVRKEDVPPFVIATHGGVVSFSLGDDPDADFKVTVDGLTFSSKVYEKNQYDGRTDVFLGLVLLDPFSMRFAAKSRTRQPRVINSREEIRYGSVSPRDIKAVSDAADIAVIEGAEPDNLIDKVKDNIIHIIMRNTLQDLKALLLSLSRNRGVFKISPGNVSRDLREKFVTPNSQFLIKNFGRGSMPIFLKDMFAGENEVPQFEGFPLPSVVLARVNEVGGKYDITFVPCEFGFYAWDPISERYVVDMKQVDPGYNTRTGFNFAEIIEAGRTGLSPEGAAMTVQELRKCKTYYDSLFNHILATGQLGSGSSIGSVGVEKGKFIAVETPGGRQAEGEGLDIRMTPFDPTDDIMLIKNDVLADQMRNLFMEAYIEYLELFGKSPPESRRLAEDVFDADPTGLFKSPLQDMFKLVMIYNAAGKRTATLKKEIPVSQLMNMKKTMQEIKAFVNELIVELSPEERQRFLFLPSGRMNEKGIEDLLIAYFLKMRPREKMPVLGTEMLIESGITEDLTHAREIIALLRPMISELEEAIDEGTVTETEVKYRIASLMRKAKYISDNILTEPTGSLQGSSITRYVEITDPPADEHTLGSKAARKAFVAERLPKDLVEEIGKAQAEGNIVEVSLHMGRDSDVRDKWDMVGSEAFQDPRTGQVYKAEKTSEKNFYWKKDSDGNLFITVTNIFGSDNRSKISKYFSELGVGHNIVFDYHIDYKQEALEQIRKAHAAGAHQGVVAIGASGVLSRNIYRRTLGYIMRPDIKEAVLRMGINSGERLSEIVRQKLREVQKATLQKLIRGRLFANEEAAKKVNEIIKGEGKAAEKVRRTIKRRNVAYDLDDPNFSIRDLTLADQEIVARSLLDGARKEIIDLIFDVVFEGFDFDLVLSIIRDDRVGVTFSSMNPEGLQMLGDLVSELRAIGMDGEEDFNVHTIADKMDPYEAQKFSKEDQEEIYSINVVRFPGEDGEVKRYAFINIADAYGDLSRHAAEAVKEAGVKKVLFTGTAGYDVSTPGRKALRQALGLQAGDIVVPLTMRNNSGDIIPGVNIGTLNKLRGILQEQERPYRIVAVTGRGDRGEVLEEFGIQESTEDDNVLTLVLAHHGVVDTILDETNAYMDILGQRGVASIEVEASKVAAVVEGEFLPTLVISDFPGEESFAEEGARVLGSDRGVRSRNIITDLAIQEVMRVAENTEIENEIMSQMLELAERIMPYIQNRNIPVDGSDMFMEGLISEVRSRDVFDRITLRSIADFMGKNAPDANVRKMISGNERYFIYGFPAFAKKYPRWRNMIIQDARKVLDKQKVRNAEAVMAIRFVAGLGDSAAVNSLLEFEKKNIRRPVRREILKQLGILAFSRGYSGRVISVLIKNLVKSEDEATRWYASFFLRDSNDPGVLDAMRNMLRDPEDPEQNWVLVANMMNSFKYNEFINEVSEALDSDNEIIRNIAVAIIGKYADDGAMDILSPLLDDPSEGVAETVREVLEARNILPSRRVKVKAAPKDISPRLSKLHNRINGVFLGVGIGDALGVPVEFMSFTDIEDSFGIVDGYVSSDRRPRQVLKRGDISDDTYMTLALADSIINFGDFDPVNVSRNFGELARSLDSGEVVDSGYSFSTMRVLRLLSLGINWRYTGSEEKLGNGAAMRTSAIGVLGHSDPVATRDAAAKQAMMTHKSVESIASAQAVAFIVAKMLTFEGEFNAEQLAEDVARHVQDVSGGFAEKIRKIPGLLSVDSREALRQLGDSKDRNVQSKAISSVPAAIYLFMKHHDDFKQGLTEAVNYSADADTVASMTGAMIGAFVGSDGIPDEWKDGLGVRRLLESTGDKMFEVSLQKADSLKKDTGEKPRIKYKYIGSGKEAKKAVEVIMKELGIRPNNKETGIAFGKAKNSIERYLKGELTEDALRSDLERLSNNFEALKNTEIIERAISIIVDETGDVSTIEVAGGFPGTDPNRKIVKCSPGEPIGGDQLGGAYFRDQMENAGKAQMNRMFGNLFNNEPCYVFVLGGDPTDPDGNQIPGSDVRISKVKSGAENMIDRKGTGKINLRYSMGAEDAKAHIREIMKLKDPKGENIPQARINCSISSDVLDKLEKDSAFKSELGITTSIVEYLSKNIMLDIIDDHIGKDGKNIVYLTPFGRATLHGLAKINYAYLVETSPDDKDAVDDALTSLSYTIALLSNNIDKIENIRKVLEERSEEYPEFFQNIMEIALPEIQGLDYDLIKKAYDAESQVLRSL